MHISAALLIFGKKSRQSRFLLKNLRAIIRLHPTTEGVEIPMGGRQKCGNPKKKVEFLMRPIPPVVHPACSTPLQYTIAHVMFL